VSERKPGSWFVREFENLHAAREAGLFDWVGVGWDCFNGEPVGAVYRNVDEHSTTGLPGCVETSLAHARLISAAPDLLRELAHLVRLMEPQERDGSLDIPGLATLNGARAAIAKAEASRVR
jgi:hypothetical protein